MSLEPEWTGKLKKKALFGEDFEEILKAWDFTRKNNRPWKLKLEDLMKEDYLENENRFNGNWMSSFQKEEKTGLLMRIFWSKDESFSLKRSLMYNIDKFFGQVNLHFRHHQHHCCIIACIFWQLWKKSNFFFKAWKFFSLGF